ncbi:MAG: DMT family transporter, partial [Pseudomonadota bacterium]|nr:DMT family transporter [Pseudomonadota bacterium]
MSGSASPPVPPLSSQVPTAAILFFIGTIVLNATTDVIAKTLVLQGMSAPFLIWARYVVQLLAVAVYFRVWRTPTCYRTDRWALHAVRGIMLALAGIFAYSALRYLQLFEFISIVFTLPAFTVLVGHLVLKEHVERRRWGAVAAGLIGVLFITRPGFGVLNLGHLLAFGAMGAYCAFMLLTRVMGRTESTEALMFVPAVVVLVALVPVVPGQSVAGYPLWVWALVSSLGMLGTVAHLLMVRAYQLAP